MKAFLFVWLTTFFVYFSYKGYNLDRSVFTGSDREEQYYYKSLLFAKENTELKAQLSRMVHEVQKLKSKNHYLTLKLEEKNEIGQASLGRSLASFTPVRKLNLATSDTDHVQYDIYKWGEYKLYTIANREYNLKNYDKASQFYVELINQYPDSDYLSESLLLKSAYSCYRTGKYYKQAINVLDLLLRRYPHSKHYKKAKLWRGLSYFHTGDFSEFHATVEEFRVKYRNAKEWEILRQYYEKIIVRAQKL